MADDHEKDRRITPLIGQNSANERCGDGKWRIVTEARAT